MTVKDLYALLGLAMNDNPDQEVKLITYGRDGSAHGPAECSRTSGGGLNTLMIIGEYLQPTSADVRIPGACDWCGGGSGRPHTFGCPRSPRSA